MTALARQEVRHRPRETLVLNADCRPFPKFPPEFMDPRDAIAKWKNGRVEILDTWDYVIRTPSLVIEAPKIVMCRHFAPVYGEPKFCRRNVLLRDAYRCQYCGEKFPSEELTFDHVLPRAKGGTTIWTNIVMACSPCNAKKRDDVRMLPLAAPRRPTHAELMRAGLELLPSHIREEFGEWLYWEAPLDQT